MKWNRDVKLKKNKDPKMKIKLYLRALKREFLKEFGKIW